MSGFDVVLVAVDEYPDPPGRLAASDSAAKLGRLLTERGGRILDSVVVTTQQDFLDAIHRWSTDETCTASLVYVVGHGTGDGVLHDFLLPYGAGTFPYPTADLARALQKDWKHRQRDITGWTLLVLDCCESALGVDNIDAALKAVPPHKPKRYGLWPVAPGGAARTGAFVAAFERALGAFPPNDTVIRLDEVYRRIRHELGDLEPAGFLPDEAYLVPPVPDKTVVMPLDVYAALRQVIDDLPPDVRNHFLAKAQGSEVGEVAWHFTGRRAEVERLCAWLAGDGAMQVVTGEAGSGKSALLGHLVVLADPDLVALYIDSGLAPELADSPRPPDHVFRAVVHLTGKTMAEAVDDIATQLWPNWNDDDIGPLIPAGYDALFAAREFASVARAFDLRGAPILVDALDESQDPAEIAAFLHDMAADGVLRVLVGTRRSTGEGPDQPADPSRRELLDTLHANDADLLVVERDTDAVYEYALKRLTREDSPYRVVPRVAEAVAARIAGLDQPFLFARLATAELAARDPLVPGDPVLDEMLGNGHRGLFAFALARIGGVSPSAAYLIRALAYARGRGMPRNGGIWVAAARSVGDWATEETIPLLAEIAGPYVTLDGEAGQSTYRLAHQTFVEHFHASRDYGLGHRRIAAALARHGHGGWAAANYYAVRYLPEHMVADADRTPPDDEELAALVTDARWLVRAVDLLGVDRTVDVIAAARRVARTDLVQTVERALRRSRTALSRDPAQLAGQLHARLKNERGLDHLGEDCAAAAGRPWLRMVSGRLDWRSDVETMYGLGGKLRGLGFGEVDDRPVVAIAIDHRVVLWDPRQGAPDEAGVIDLGEKRATAVAVADIDSRPVVVTSAGYDAATDVWDARTGDHLASAPFGLGHTIAVGLLGDRLVIAGVDLGRNVVLLDAETMEPVEPHPRLTKRDVRAFAVHQGDLVALCVDVAPTADEAVRIAVVDAATGETYWRTSDLATSYRMVDVVAGGDIGSELLVVAGGGGSVFWMTRNEQHTEFPAHQARLRAIAIGLVGDRQVVASAPDYDGTALIELHEVVRELNPFGDARLYRPQIVGRLGVTANLHSVYLPAELTPRPWGDRAKRFSVKRPEEWPHTAVASGELDGRPILLTGSAEGTVWVWDADGERVRAIAGPFGIVSSYVLDNGWTALYAKPGVPTADSIAYGHHVVLGPIVAVACDGNVRLYTVPGGEPVESPADEATVIDAVALGRVGDRDVLVTGSKGGVLGVWTITPPERIAVLTLDAPISRVDIDPNGSITVDGDTARAVVVDLVEP